jgi:hypothetical protein
VLALAAKRFTLASVGKALAAARDRQIAAVIVEA